MTDQLGARDALFVEMLGEMAGVVVARLVVNGRPVEYGEALFSIRPH